MCFDKNHLLLHSMEMWKYHLVKTLINLSRWADYYTKCEDTICSKTSRLHYDTLDRRGRFIIIWLHTNAVYTTCKDRFIYGDLDKSSVLYGMRIDYCPNTEKSRAIVSETVDSDLVVSIGVYYSTIDCSHKFSTGGFYHLVQVIYFPVILNKETKY